MYIKRIKCPYMYIISKYTYALFPVVVFILPYIFPLQMGSPQVFTQGSEINPWGLIRFVVIDFLHQLLQHEPVQHRDRCSAHRLNGGLWGTPNWSLLWCHSSWTSTKKPGLFVSIGTVPVIRLIPWNITKRSRYREKVAGSLLIPSRCIVRN